MSTTQYVWPPGATASNPSIGLNGATAPTSSTQIAGENGGLLVPIAVTSGGNIIIDGSGTPVPVSGTVTANQGTASAIANGWPIKPTDGTNSQVFLSTGEGKVSVTQPIAAGTNIIGKFGIDQTTPGTTNAVSSSGAALYKNATVSSVTNLISSTDVSNYSSLSLQLTFTGTATVSFFGSNDGSTWQAIFMGYLQSGVPTQVASSNQVFFSPVVFRYFKADVTSWANGSVTGYFIADQSSITDPALRNIVITNTVPVSQSGTWDIRNVSGTVSLPTGASTAALQTTGNTSLASIVTNTTGASTSALQTTGNTALTTINTTLGSPFQAGGSIGNTTFSSTQSGTWDIRNVSGTVSLPTGAATAANQATANTSLASIATNTANIPTVGQKTMAASAPIVIASDQSPIPISGTVTTSAPVWKESYNYSIATGQITTAAYTAIAASLANNVTAVEIYCSDPQAILIFAEGAGGSEVNKFYIPTGGNSPLLVYHSISSSTRVSVKALNTAATTGYVIMNFYG